MERILRYGKRQASYSSAWTALIRIKPYVIYKLTLPTNSVAALYAFVNPLYLRCSLWPNFCGYSSVWTLRARLANFSSVRRQRTLTATQTERSNSKDTGLRYAVRPH